MTNTWGHQGARYDHQRTIPIFQLQLWWTVWWPWHSLIANEVTKRVLKFGCFTQALPESQYFSHTYTYSLPNDFSPLRVLL